jgi:Fe-Mn family superoxide dismutase
MTKISRRAALAGMATAASAILIGDSDADAQTAQSPAAEAFRGQHQVRPLPFDPAKLTGISEKLIRSHHENNYAGSVRALNAIEQRLASLMKDAELPAFVYGDLKREELIRTGSVILHEQYFANLGGNGKADGTALKQIERWFGSYGAWEAEFKRTANALSGGSGWAILAYNSHTRSLHNYWASDHSQSAAASTPLLVLDMYEHSYQMDYGAAAAKYVDAFMQNVNWDEVNRRMEPLKI